MTAPAGTIDTHCHVWEATRHDHTWLASEHSALRRDFHLDELVGTASTAGTAGAVLVQALAVEAETKYLLELAGTCSLVRGVVGWADLTRPDVGEAIGALRAGAGGDLLVGTRHLVQGEADPQWLVRPDVARSLKAVAGAGLTYDLLVQPHQLPAAIEAVDAVPEVRFVLDHGGKPPIASGATEPWWSLIADLGRRPNVMCKVSGLVSQAGASWGPTTIEPYLVHLVEVFGPERLMFGSDWPMFVPWASYDEVVSLAWSLLSRCLGIGEADRVMAANWQEAYRLG